MTLEDARLALVSDDQVAALRHLVAFWRERPVTEVADHIGALDAEVWPMHIDDHQEWLDLAKSPTIDNSGVLARSLLVNPRARAQERIEAAIEAAWSPDPRLGVVLHDALAKVRWTANSSRVTWHQFFALLDRSGDPRFLAWQPEFAVRANQQRWLERHYKMPTLRARFPDGPPSLTEAEQETWRQILDLLAPSSAEEREEDTIEDLLAAVYAHPEEDAPRLVLADWLMERGDPTRRVLTRREAPRALDGVPRAHLRDRDRDAGRRGVST
jgi:uncharacterized protein (TIGR02996 family)